MTIGAPQSAPPRPDLVFLRRRARRPVAPVPAPAPAPAPSPSPTPAAPVSLDLSAPAPAPASAPGAPPPVSLDLSAPEVVPAAPQAPGVAAGRAPVAAPGVAPPGVAVRRVRAGRPQVLTAKAPVLTLTRVQSGIGVMTIEAACSDAVGDLRLGCAYRLRNGLTSVVQHDSGLAGAPPGSTRPILLGERDRFETLTLDLGQVRELDRMLVYAFSAAAGQLAWGGTLTLTTFGGSRVEVPLDGPKSTGVLGLVTVYNVDGELVIRAEPRELSPTVREAALEFGFDRIAWLDPHTPAA